MPSALIFLILGGSNVAVFALETVAASRGGSLGAQAASVSDAEISADRIFVVISFPYVNLIPAAVWTWRWHSANDDCLKVERYAKFQAEKRASSFKRAV